MLLRHLRDFEAFLGTVSARLGARGHVLVIWHCFAGSGTLVTTLRTAQQGVGRESALPGAQCGTHLAAFCAVHAQTHALGMLLFSVSDEGSAMIEARIARHRAIRARQGALFQVIGVRTVRRKHGAAHSEQGEGDGTQ